MLNNDHNERMQKFKAILTKELFIKSVLIPLIFVVATVVVCIVLSNPKLGIFPNANDACVVSTTQVENNSVNGVAVENG